MADKQDGWLDRETAERLLRGASADDAVGPAASKVDRDEAEQLVRTLAALSSLADAPAADTGELPGEAAALAAFRSARAADAPCETPAAHPPVALTYAGQEAYAVDELSDLRTARRTASVAVPRPRTAVAHESDAGLVRIGRPRTSKAGGRSRWSRTARFSVAAALAVGLAGGVAVAAGTGVLPGPFDGEPAPPGASVSAPASPERPLVSPEADVTAGATGRAVPDTPGSAGGSAAPGASGDTGSRDDGTDARDGEGHRRDGALSSCRDLRAGRTPDADRTRALERLAGGPARVRTYCADLLKSVAGRGDGRGDSRDGQYGRDGRDGKDRDTRDTRDGRNGYEPPGGDSGDGSDGSDGGSSGRGDGDDGDGDGHHRGHGGRDGREGRDGRDGHSRGGRGGHDGHHNRR
ncbi:hypothetical protein ABZX99_01760 [Streptomyces antibioticus]|uniref:hypothetical protein n=1 Tax=Streptomyces antibioticus TaxID=1890 RepID=UPI0033A3BE16